MRITINGLPFLLESPAFADQFRKLAEEPANAVVFMYVPGQPAHGIPDASPTAFVDGTAFIVAVPGGGTPRLLQRSRGVDLSGIVGIALPILEALLGSAAGGSVVSRCGQV